MLRPPCNGVMLLHLGPTDGVSKIKRTNVTKNKKDMQSAEDENHARSHETAVYSISLYTLL